MSRQGKIGSVKINFPEVGDTLRAFGVVSLGVKYCSLSSKIP